jgi:hypothetical protein
VAGQNRGCGDDLRWPVYNVTGINGYKGGSLPSSQTQPCLTSSSSSSLPLHQWPTSSRPLPPCAVARTRIRSHHSIIHPLRIPETTSAFHTPLVFHAAPVPTMLPRLSSLGGGEVAVTAGPATVILTTAQTTTTAGTMVTPGAPIASAPTGSTTTVLASMYVSIFFH